jgi:hypothetical protein
MRIITLLFISLLALQAGAQSPFSISVVPLKKSVFPGVQAAAPAMLDFSKLPKFGQSDSRHRSSAIAATLPEGYYVRDSLERSLNRCHFSTASLFSIADSVEHTLVFGGAPALSAAEKTEGLGIPPDDRVGCISRYPHGKIIVEKVGELPASLDEQPSFLPIGITTKSSGYVQPFELPAPGDSILIGYLAAKPSDTELRLPLADAGEQNRKCDGLFCVYLKAKSGTLCRPPVFDAELAFNPVENALKLKVLLSEKSQLQLELINTAGKLVGYLDLGHLPKGIHRHFLPFHGLPAGQYWAGLGSGQYRVAIPFVKH